MTRIVIVVPARLASRRLPRKVLLPVAGKPLLIWACESAERARRVLQKDGGEARDGEEASLLVACAEREIKDCAERHGFSALLTDADLPSGSDRVWQAVSRFDPQGRTEVVINYQADLPDIAPRVFVDAVAALRSSGADIATPVVAIEREQAERPSVVKAILAGSEDEEEAQGQTQNAKPQNAKPQDAKPQDGKTQDGKGCRSYSVLAFTRACAPWSDRGRVARYWHHIGIYAYRRQALSRFVSLAPSPLERREGLEQMRALEAGMKIVAFVCDSQPVEINLEEERAAFEQRVLAQEGARL